MEVRTNREQFAALLRERSIVIASGLALTGLAVVAGIALTANVLALLVYRQRRAFAALRAAGVSGGTLLGGVASQALLMGVGGGLLGIAATPALVRASNLVAERLVGYSGLARLTDWILLVGFGLAVVIGLLGGLVAGWRVLRIGPLDQLSR